MRKFAFFIVFLMILAGCNSRKSKIENIDLQISIERLDQELYNLRNDSLCLKLDTIREQYGDFFEFYNTGIINIGESRHELYCDFLHRFLSHTIVDSAYQKVNEIYADDNWLNEELTSIFKHYKFYFPKSKIPRIITYVSGFNEALMLTEDAVGIGLDNFLGSDFSIYTKLGKSVYQQYNMRPEYVPVACLQTWLIGEFPENFAQENTLLAKMIYEGKILYALKQCFPKKSFDQIIGYKPEQLQWCLNNEQQMWQQLIEQQLLYTTTPFVIQKYTGEAPFTAGFSQESPGKAANWLGFRIVENYVKRSGCSLEELMLMPDSKTILKEAKYNP